MDNVNMTNVDEFVDWLNSELKARKKIQADIARLGIVTDAAVSNLFSKKTKSLTFDMCLAISKGIGIQLEDVYIKAGLLPPKPDMHDPFIKDVLAQLTQITDEEDRDLLGEIIGSFLRRAEERKVKVKKEWIRQKRRFSSTC